jgi:hypothetical protein
VLCIVNANKVKSSSIEDLRGNRQLFVDDNNMSVHTRAGISHNPNDNRLAGSIRTPGVGNLHMVPDQLNHVVHHQADNIEPMNIGEGEDEFDNAIETEEVELKKEKVEYKFSDEGSIGEEPKEEGLN